MLVYNATIHILYFNYFFIRFLHRNPFVHTNWNLYEAQWYLFLAFATSLWPSMTPHILPCDTRLPFLNTVTYYDPLWLLVTLYTLLWTSTTCIIMWYLCTECPVLSNSATITSPAYPGGYGNYEDYCWTFSVGAGYVSDLRGGGGACGSG